MSWHPRMLRFVSALSLALTLFAALPHLHAEDADGTTSRVSGLTSAGQPSAERTSTVPVSAALTSADLTSDDAHESHRATLDAESHPCALCRGRQELEHAATPTAPLAIARSEDPCRAIARDRLAPVGRLVRRAPARAPPLA